MEGKSRPFLESVHIDLPLATDAHQRQRYREIFILKWRVTYIVLRVREERVWMLS